MKIKAINVDSYGGVTIRGEYQDGDGAFDYNFDDMVRLGGAGLTEENICHIADTLRSLHKDYGELKPYIEYQIGETRPATEGDN